MGNLRQTALGLQIYLGDYNDCLHWSNGYGYWFGGNWPERLWGSGMTSQYQPYPPAGRNLYLPAHVLCDTYSPMPSSHKPWKQFGVNGFYGASLAVTIYLCYGNAMRNNWQEAGYPNWDSGDRLFYPLKVKAPSDLFLWGDALAYRSPPFDDWMQWLKNYVPTDPVGVWLIHGRKANILFLDGHAETADPTRIARMSAKDLTRDQNWFPANLISEDGSVVTNIALYK
jgi:prepilin-type processing-associated H-X9-DG protein